ncbi:hypothetical protein BB561_005471 [Smittium simulii]|uniref:HMG box domain-containing protein n=1 Tax=Smittium simulii TaxID=133385 RepID=A0A2T9YA90_9FUNG|nr:hypothetical protein BB561_005471 [Smittium simulii]
MSGQLRLVKGKSLFGLATRSCIVGQHKPISSAAVLWQHGVSLAIYSSKKSLLATISIRHYSLKSNDANLPGDDKFEQNVPTSHSIKSLKSTKVLPKTSKNIESNEDNSHKLKKAKLLELQKLKKTKTLNALKLNKVKMLKALKLEETKHATQAKDRKLKQAKLQKLKEAKQVKLQKLKEAKLLKAQKLKEAKLLKAQKLKASKQAKNLKLKEAKQKKLNALKKLELRKKLTSTKRLVVPIRTRSTYLLYIIDEYKKMMNDPTYITNPNNLDQSITNISTVWKNKTEAEKLEYDQKFKPVKEQISTEYYKWWDNVDKKLIKLENSRRRSLNKIRKLDGKNSIAMLVHPRAPKRPSSASMLVHPRAPKRPSSACAIFVKDLKELNNPDAPTRLIDFIKYAAAKWNRLTESEKDVYKHKFKAAFKLYSETNNKYV